MSACRCLACLFGPFQNELSTRVHGSRHDWMDEFAQRPGLHPLLRCFDGGTRQAKGAHGAPATVDSLGRNIGWQGRSHRCHLRRGARNRRAQGRQTDRVAPADEPPGADARAGRRTDPCDGTAYVFSNRRHTRLKLVCWDGNGVWLCQRRLHRGQFVWPQAGDTSGALTDAQWQWLIAGVDWQRLTAEPPAYWQL
jgi:transposase